MGSRDAVDDVDSAIIRVLVESPRCSYSDLAERVGVSAGTAQVRVKRLRQSRCVTIAGRVDPAVLGYGVFAFVFVEASRSALEAARLLSRRPEAAFVVTVGGSAGLIAELRCRDWRHLMEVVGDTRRELRSAHTRLAILESYYKHDWSTFHSGAATANTHNERPAYLVDDIDIDILKILASDGRATYSDIARQAAVSPGTARQRVKHLQQTGAVTVQTVVASGLLGLAGYAAVGMTVTGPAETIARQIAQQAPVALAATVLGAFDVVAEIGYRDFHDLGGTLDTLRCIPGVTQIESFPYLTELKESMGSWPMDRHTTESPITQQPALNPHQPAP